MIDIDLNGERRTVEGSADTPLLYVLRNQFGLVGTRFGCGSHNRVVKAILDAR